MKIFKTDNLDFLYNTTGSRTALVIGLAYINSTSQLSLVAMQLPINKNIDDSKNVLYLNDTLNQLNIF